MSEKLIPEHVDPFRYAEQGLNLEGAVKIIDMQRLSSMTLPRDEVVKVDLKFGIDEQDITFLKGHLSTILSLQCQRCMDAFDYEIMTDFFLAIVRTLEEANDLPESYEPALVKDGYLALRELIEDEIILNLPLIPKHSPEQCHVRLSMTDAEWEQSKQQGPFHVLESLKERNK